MLDLEVLVAILITALTAGLGRLAWTCRRQALALEAARGRLELLSKRVRRLESSSEGPAAAPVDPPPRAARRIDRATPEAAAGPTLIAVPNLAASAGLAASSDVSAELDRRFSRVWELAGRGSNAETIARETGQPVGQVELILGLRRQAAAVGPATRPTSRGDAEHSES